MPLSASPLSEQAAGQIMDMILVEKRFQTGDKLPNELELAQELGISRVTLREAVRILCTRGIVEIQRGRGTFVTASEPSASLSPLESLAVSNRDLLEIRMMAEPTAAYYAAKRATDEEKKRIHELSDRIEEALGARVGIQERLKLEQDFHNAIATAGHNQFMTHLLPIINKSIYTDVTNFEESVTYSLRDHREIVQFIEDGNAEAAKAAMRMHIVHAYKIANLSIE